MNRNYNPLNVTELQGRSMPNEKHCRMLHEETDADNPAQETNDGEEAFTDEDFERLLDEFIASEMTACQTDECEAETAGGAEADDNKDGAEEPLLASMEHLTGLKSVKEKLTAYEKTMRFNKARMAHALPVMNAPLHAMFLGSPGTGKTTVAKLMGSMLAKAGMLSTGHVVVRERATLLGPNYSMEETNTLKAIEEAQGGVLFIDEAYQLYQPNDPRDPGRFVIETLLTALADEQQRDWMLILAGYPEEMRRMFDMNPGFKSRIPDSNIYVFDDFTEPELMEIAERYLERHRFTLSSEARQALWARLAADFARRGRNLGNARYVMNLIQTEILPAMAARVIELGLTDVQSLTEIQAADIPLPVRTLIPSRPRIGFCA